MALGPITSWQIDGKKSRNSTDFIFLGSKITADGDSSHEIKDACSLEVITHLDSALKSRGITLLTNVHKIKAIVFPVVMYGFESWARKKAEH